MTLDTGVRILVVDDEIRSIELLSELFQDYHEVLFATDGEEAVAIATSAMPDVILLDVMIPGLNGFEVCTKLKANDATAHIPIIFITGRQDQDAEVLGLELGGADYVTKPFNPLTVQVRVRNQIELKQARDLLTRRALTDGLTGLANRRHFDETLHTEYMRHSRSQDTLSVLLLDVDFFKAFNDNYGHLKGDDCLRDIASVLYTQCGRATDLPARYGGEEFICVLPATDSEGALAIGEQIVAAVRQLKIPHAYSPTAPYLTISVGIATSDCPSDQSPLALVAAADNQLYRAKAGGRNQVCAGTSDHG